MSLMGGSTQSLPAIDQRPFGIQEQRANTNQQARPVPLLYGKQRLGITFISDAFDLLADPVTQSVGKQAETVGNNFYASFAFIVCHGPVDGLHDLFLNGEPVYTSQTLLYAISLTSTGTSGDTFYTATFQTANAHGLSTGDTIVIIGADQPAYNGEFTITVVSATQFQYQIAPTDATPATWTQSGGITAQIRLDPVFRDDDNPDFVDVTVPNFGVLRLYWGTETQTADTYLNTKSGVVHPPYLGMCWGRWMQLFFGYNQTNVPNMEIVVSRAPLPSWATLESGDINNEANPAYLTADLFQNSRNGLMLSDADIDTTALDDAAQGFNTEGLGVSQVLSRAQDLRSTLTTLCETIDALPIPNADGLLSMFPIRPPADIGALTTVADADLADLPQITPADWTTTYSVTWATFSNADLQWQDDMRGWRDQGQLNVVRNTDPLTLDRRWITSATIAQFIANASGQAAAIPVVTGKLKLRYTDALFAALAPGNNFLLDYSLRPSDNLILRVTDRSIPDPESPEIDIEFQADRAYLYTALIVAAEATPPEAHVEIPDVPTPVTVPVNTRLLLFELPAALCPGVPALGAVIARDSAALVSFSVWLNKNYAWTGAPPDSYSMVANKSIFAFHGFTQSDYAHDTRLIDLEQGILVKLDGPDQSLNPITAFEALADATLCFLDDEIVSLAGWTLLGTGLYRLKVIRGRFGTPIQDHEAGARILIINRADLAVITSPAFQPDNVAQLKVTLGGRSAGDVEETDVTFNGTAWRVPPPPALAVNGTSFNPIFPGGLTPVAITWGLPDPGGMLPKFGTLKLYTRLEIYIAAGADSDATVDSTLITADGGPLDLSSHTKIFSVDVAWPLKTYSLAFATATGAPDQNFLIIARTVVDMGWKQILSASAEYLQVNKYP